MLTWDGEETCPVRIWLMRSSHIRVSSCDSVYSLYTGQTTAVLAGARYFLFSSVSIMSKFKGTVHLKSKSTYFLPHLLHIYVSSLFWCELRSFGDIGKTQMFASSLMKVNGTQQHLFPEIVTSWLKIIQRPCCEQLRGGTFYRTTLANCFTLQSEYHGHVTRVCFSSADLYRH